ncbi:MAG TPA: 3-phosphoshikimate 1-carboxyvinyltransferase [Opitutaceae bacterium]|nr:3-phosphoshikimate 1-carboxyvinyltransferase [Opitutaceae bacterium]
MTLPDFLPVIPFTRPVRGSAILPGSKSLTNRALLLAALAETPVTLTGALFSEDTQLMAAALRAIGFQVEADAAAGTVHLSGQHQAYAETNSADPIPLFVGLAGTAARFLTALCAAAPRGTYRIDGVAQMRKRPMRPLIEALRTLGVPITCLGEEGFFPLEIKGGFLRGGTVSLDASESSQLLSALLMIAPRSREPITVALVGSVRWTFVEMTLRLMAEFGVTLPRPDTHAATMSFAVPSQPYCAPATYVIEPDATAASYFQTLPLVVGGSLELPGLRPPGAGLQGDSAYLEVVRRVQARPPGKRLDEDFHEISDTFLTLAAIAPLLKGPTHISGIAHTRKQETDRVAGMARELRRLGQDVIEEHDSLTITPRPLRQDQVIETYGDHRFAMSFGILGSYDLRGDGTPWLTIKDPGCCAKTFPHFFTLLDTLRRAS